MRGAYRISILDAKSKKVLWEQPDWLPNVILNDGMDRVATNSICNAFLYGSVGTGTSTDNVSGGTTQATTTGTTVDLTGGSFLFDTGSPGDVGNVIKWDNTGFEGRIVSVASTIQATITPLPGVGQTGTFVLYRTNRTGLQAESKRTTTYVGIAPFNQTVLSGADLTHTRTWDFTEEVGSVTYNEVGTTWNSTFGTPNTTFSRKNLAVPVSLVAGQQLRLQYRLTLTMSPSVATPKLANVSGWPVAPSTVTDGDESFQYVGLSSVTTTGGTSVYDAGQACNEPSASTSVAIFLSPSSAVLTALAAVPPSRQTNSTQKTVTLVAYSALSFQRIKQVDFTSGEANRTDFRSMGVGSTVSGFHSADRTGIAFVFDESQTKDNAHTLNLQWIYSWSRVLTP